MLWSSPAARVALAVAVVGLAAVVPLGCPGGTSDDGGKSEDGDPNVVYLADDDPRMKAAVAEARRRWPEFVAAFATRAAGQHFSVKARFTEGEAEEVMWLTVAGIEGALIKGTLDNEPHDIKTLKLGDPVVVKVDEMSDWMYPLGDKRAGGFTVKVLLEAKQKQATGK